MYDTDNQKLNSKIMTSSNGNIFRVTGSLCGEFTGHWWIPLTKASDAELWCFLLCAWTKCWANNRDAGDLRRHCTHYDVTAMIKDWLKVSKLLLGVKKTNHIVLSGINSNTRPIRTLKNDGNNISKVSKTVICVSLQTIDWNSTITPHFIEHVIIYPCWV